MQFSILIVEDNAPYVKLLRTGLGKVGMASDELHHAPTMEEALVRLSSRRFDLILLDMNLPDSQGIDTINRIRPLATGTPIVVLTGMEDAELQSQAMQAGAQDYLVKGHSDWEVLSRAIRYAVHAKRSEDEIQRLASFPQLSPSPILEVDHKGKITFCNHAGFEILRELGMEDDGSSFLPADIDHILARLDQDKPENFHRLKVLGDRYFVEEIYTSPHFKVARIYARDLTDRKRAEDELARERNLLRTIIDHIPDMVYVKDIAGRYILVNNVFTEFMGRKSPDDVIGQTDAELLGERAAEKTSADEYAIIETGQPLADYEECKVDALGGRSWTLTTKVPLHDDSGKTIGIVGVGRDITFRKQAEETLKEKAAGLARSNEDLRNFAYVASHDLQEPLRTVTSFLTLLQNRYKGKLDENADKFIFFATDGANRMRALIDDLLEYSRVDSRARPFSPTSMADVLARIKANLAASIKESSAVIESGDLPTIIADTMQMHILLQNLISNAIKFRGETPPQISIVAAREETGTGWRFCIKDNGIGIPGNSFERIFNVFTRLHTREKYPGTGMGLAICKKIVDRHNGKIWVESEPGKGAAFYIALPDNPVKGTLLGETPVE